MSSAIQDDTATLLAEIKALQSEVNLKQKMNQTLKKANDVYEKRQNLHKNKIANLEKKIRQLEEGREGNSNSSQSVTINGQNQKMSSLIAENRKLQETISKLEKEYQSKIQEYKQDLDSKIEALNNAETKLSQMEEAVSLGIPDMSEQSKVSSLLDENRSLLKKIQELQTVHKSQIKRVETEFTSKVEALNKEEKQLSNIKGDVSFELPDTISQESNINSKKGKFLNTERTVDEPLSIKKGVLTEEKVSNTSPEAPAVHPDRFKKKQKPQLKIQQSPVLKLQAREAVQPEQNSMIILNQADETNIEDEKQFDIDNDYDCQNSQRVAPLNKKIMDAIMNHYETIDLDGKWPYLNMICAWAETKMEDLCLSYEQMDFDDS